MHYRTVCHIVWPYACNTHNRLYLWLYIISHCRIRGRTHALHGARYAAIGKVCSAWSDIPDEYWETSEPSEIDQAIAQRNIGTADQNEAKDAIKTAKPQSLLRSISVANFVNLRPKHAYDELRCKVRLVIPTSGSESQETSNWLNNKEASVFSTLQDDTHELLSKAFDSDCLYMKLKRIIADLLERRRVEEHLRRSFCFLKDIFRFYAANDQLFDDNEDNDDEIDTDPFTMSLAGFIEFVRDCQILDDKVTPDVLSEIFATANQAIARVDSKVNPGDELGRYEFVESIVRLALAKYEIGKGDGKIMPRNAVVKLLRDHVYPFVAPISLQAYRFRLEVMYSESVDKIIREHLLNLKESFGVYASIEDFPGIGKAMNLLDFLRWCDDKNVYDERRETVNEQDEYAANARDNNALTVAEDRYFDRLDVPYIFSSSIMTVLDHSKSSGRERYMTFVEFLQAIVRIAFTRYNCAHLNKKAAADSLEDEQATSTKLSQLLAYAFGDCGSTRASLSPQSGNVVTRKGNRYAPARGEQQSILSNDGRPQSVSDPLLGVGPGSSFGAFSFHGEYGSKEAREHSHHSHKRFAFLGDDEDQDHKQKAKHKHKHHHHHHKHHKKLSEGEKLDKAIHHQEKEFKKHLKRDFKKLKEEMKKQLPDKSQKKKNKNRKGGKKKKKKGRKKK